MLFLYPLPLTSKNVIVQGTKVKTIKFMVSTSQKNVLGIKVQKLESLFKCNLATFTTMFHDSAIFLYS